jgi:hypothetical protein
MALALTRLPDQEPTRKTLNPRVQVGPFVRDVLPDTDTAWEVHEPIGVRATCELFVDIGVEHPFVIIQRIETPGVWGIETDDQDGDAYVAEVFEEEKATLLAMLRAMGIHPLTSDVLTEVTS